MSIMLDAGDEPGFLAQAQRVHGTMWPDGQEGRFYVRKDLPDDHPLAKKWDNDPILKSNPIAYVSEGDGGKGAVTPFKSTKDILKLMTDVTEKPDAYFAARKQLKEKISTLNASQEPFMGDDGKRYINEFIEGKGGQLEKKVVPYTGIARESKLQEKVREAETALGGIRPDDKRKLAGLDTEDEIALRRANAAKARAEATEKVGGKGGKQALETTGKQRDIFKKDLNILLSPFVTKGEPVLNPETGEMTEAGNNALIAAAKLVEKNNADPNSLTSGEKRYLKHAEKALKIYDKMSASIAEDYGESDAGKPSPAAIEAEAKRRGLVKDANGKWVKPGRSGPEENTGYGNRTDGTPKGKGFFGELKRPDGRVSTELSIGVEFDGKEMEIPALVPTLSQSEIDYLLGGGKPTRAIVQKAVDHAKKRIAEGKSPYAEEGEKTKREPTAMDKNATRASLVAGHIGAVREKTALDNLTTDDLAEAGRAALSVVTGPFRRVKQDYEEQKRRSGR